MEWRASPAPREARACGEYRISALGRSCVARNMFVDECNTWSSSNFAGWRRGSMWCFAQASAASACPTGAQPSTCEVNRHCEQSAPVMVSEAASVVAVKPPLELVS